MHLLFLLFRKIQGRDGHLQPGGQPPSRSQSPAFGRRRSSLSPPRGRSPTPIGRSQSPARHPDFTDLVSGMADFVHEKHENKKRGRSRGPIIFVIFYLCIFTAGKGFNYLYPM